MAHQNKQNARNACENNVRVHPRQFRCVPIHVFEALEFERMVGNPMAGKAQRFAPAKLLHWCEAGKKSLHWRCELTIDRRCGGLLKQIFAGRAYNSVRRIQPHCPRHALSGLRAAIDQIAKAKNLIGIRLGGEHRLKRRPIAVDAGKNQAFHTALLPGAVRPGCVGWELSNAAANSSCGRIAPRLFDTRSIFITRYTTDVVFSVGIISQKALPRREREANSIATTTLPLSGRKASYAASVSAIAC